MYRFPNPYIVAPRYNLPHPKTFPKLPHIATMPIKVLVHQSDTVRKCQNSRLKLAIKTIAEDYGWTKGVISLALVSDPEIHEVNRNHLQHDYPTDVISFDLTESDDLLEGEVIASVETADRESVEHHWDGNAELLLYVIHGTLHIIGLRDKKPNEIRAMREAERYYLELFGESPTPNRKRSKRS